MALLDTEKIRQLIDMMVANDLAELSLREGDVEVKLHRRPPAGEVVATLVPQQVVANPGQPIGAQPPVAEASNADDDTELIEIKSPMVGTFYTGPDPDSPPYAQVGAHIHSDSVVCIVEAMKVFNEIKAEVAGTIERVLVKNEQAVEYGQPLFLVRGE